MQIGQRKIYFDYLRILACFLVIFNHTPGYIIFQFLPPNINSFYYLFFTFITRINVPLFLMISGALLLPGDITYRKLLTVRVPRILGALICSSVVYYIVSNIHNLSSLRIGDFLQRLVAGSHAVQYWYLYAYLGFLLMLPFMQAVAKKLTSADFIFLLALHFIMETFLPLTNYILSCYGIPVLDLSYDFSIPLITIKAFFYPLIGYYLEHNFEITRLSKKHIITLVLSAFLGIIIPSCFTYHQGFTSEFTQNFVQTFDYITAIIVFLVVKYIVCKTPTLNNSKIVPFISSLTFGIYLMDPVLQYCGKGKIFDAVVPATDPIFYSIVWCFYSMVLCGIATYLLKKIPIVKNLL